MTNQCASQALRGMSVVKAKGITNNSWKLNESVWYSVWHNMEEKEKKHARQKKTKRVTHLPCNVLSSHLTFLGVVGSFLFWKVIWSSRDVHKHRKLPSWLPSCVAKWERGSKTEEREAKMTRSWWKRTYLVVLELFVLQDDSLNVRTLHEMFSSTECLRVLMENKDEGRRLKTRNGL